MTGKDLKPCIFRRGGRDEQNRRERRRAIRQRHSTKDSRAHALVPLVNRIIMYKHRLDLYSAQETEVINGAIVYVEGNSGLF